MCFSDLLSECYDFVISKTYCHQTKLLGYFYEEIYQGERNFATNEEVSELVDEYEPDDDIHDSNLVETKAGVNRKPVIDLNTNKKAPEDEPEAAIPRKQTLDYE